MTAIAVLACAGQARAHAPTTAIGRAVEAFRSVPVSYEPGAAVSDFEAGRFPLIVGSNPKVAFMSASASSELAGEPSAIAEEIAREADLDGTLVVLVGTELGAWSSDIRDDRLAELVAEAQALGAGLPPAAVVESLARSVQAEPTGDAPWSWIAAVLLVLAVGSAVAFGLVVRRRPRRDPRGSPAA